MNLIEQSVRQIRKENLKNYYDTEQAEEEFIKGQKYLKILKLNMILILLKN